MLVLAPNFPYHTYFHRLHTAHLLHSNNCSHLLDLIRKAHLGHARSRQILDSRVRGAAEELAYGIVVMHLHASDASCDDELDAR